MSEFNLKARSPLDGYSEQFDGATLHEVTGQTIVSIAAPNDGEENLAGAIQKAYGIGPLAVGRSAVSMIDGTRLLRLQRDLMFAIFDSDKRSDTSRLLKNSPPPSRGGVGGGGSPKSKSKFGISHPSYTPPLAPPRQGEGEKKEAEIKFQQPARGVAAMANKLGNAGYYTEQTDAWVLLQISGPLSRDALARICLIDLNAEAFDIDDLARTVMEHMDAIIVRVDEDAFLLLSARSSAKSFLHAVETSIKNVN